MGDHMRQIAIICGLAAALAVSAAVRAEDMAADDTQISKAEWLSGMAAAIPTELCKDDSSFRECFKIEKAECEKSVASAAQPCLDKIKGELPESLHQPADGEKWGLKVGECVGEGFFTANLSKMVDSEKCTGGLGEAKSQ